MKGIRNVVTWKFDDDVYKNFAIYMRDVYEAIKERDPFTAETVITSYWTQAAAMFSPDFETLVEQNITEIKGILKKIRKNESTNFDPKRPLSNRKDLDNRELAMERLRVTYLLFNREMVKLGLYGGKKKVYDASHAMANFDS